MIQRFFYLKQQNQIFGPFAAAQLLQMYRAGTITTGDRVSPDKVNWVDAVSFLTGQPSPHNTSHIALNGNIRLTETDTDTDDFLASSHPETDAAFDFDQTPAKRPPPPQIIERRTASPGMFCGVMALLLLLTLLCGGGLYVFMHGFPFDFDQSHGMEDTSRNTAASTPTPQTTSDSAGKDWQTIARENKNAIGVVVLDITFRNGQQYSAPLGTAWANSANSFVTNAHVVLGGYGQKKKDPNILSAGIYVAMNGSSKRHLIESIQIHLDFLAGKSDSDFAVLYTRSPIQSYLSCASKNELRQVQQGDEIMYLGFPMEGLHQQNLNLQCPMATMQKGCITTISDFSYGDGGFEGNTLIRHSLPTVGGVSGSPLFARNGKVIAILFAGNMDVKAKQDMRTGQVITEREASAAMVNFAIRIDRLTQCLQNNKIPATDFLEGK